MTETNSALSQPADVLHPGSRRSLLLCAAGALLGLAIAGVSLFTAQGTRTAIVPPENAAVVNGVPVLRADLIDQLSSLYGEDFTHATPEQKRKVLDDMIREEVYVQRGVEMGLANDDIDVRTALIRSAEAQAAQETMTARPSEQELRAWYDTHVGDYAEEGRMELHEWLLPTGVDGAAAAAGLRGGVAPASLGLRSSGRVDDGEEFYFAAAIHLGPQLFAVARDLSAGGVSEPVAMPDGVHILQMVGNTRPVPTAFEAVRDRVLRDFQTDKVNRLQAANEKFLRTRADIKIADDLQ